MPWIQNFAVRVGTLGVESGDMHRNAQTGKLTVKEAGRLGGLTTLARHGLAHYREAGRKGQAKFSAQFEKAQRRRWGLTGGRPKRHGLPLGEERQKR